ncbi:MAG: SDR family oxidoreductase [Pseudomonadota bacterium]
MATHIITGAAGGIAAALIPRVATSGDTLLLIDIAEAPLAAAAEAAVAAGAHVRTRVSALDTEEACRAAIADAGETIIALTHLAGVFEPDPAGPADMSVYHRALSANLTNAYMLAGFAAPAMTRAATPAHPARMVFISSLAFTRGSWDHVPYTAAKGGLVGLTRALSRKHAPDILVNALAPGVIDTAMPAHLLALRGEDRITREVPLGRLGRADEVAGAIAFLLGPDSTFITGQTIHVDGGATNA